MTHWPEALEREVANWTARGWPRPDIALVSGSGLAVDLGAPIVAPLPLAALLPFPLHAVPGHPHQVEMISPRPGRTAVYFRGRLHGYQGYEPGDVVFPIRLAARLGAQVLLMTNASGGLDPARHAGDLVLVSDQINLTGWTPLRGSLPESWGPQFPDMSGAYDEALRALAHRHAAELGIELHDGVYLGLSGPSYETPAEVAAFRSLGAHAVGMSTVLEVIAARQMGMRCCCLSVVSNPGAGVGGAALSHEAVLAAGRAAAGRVQRLLAALLAEPALLS